MRKIALIAVAATTLFTSGALAQGIGIGVGPGGVGVSVDDGHRHGHRHGYRERHHHHDHDRDWRRSRNETVIIKERRPRRIVKEVYTD